MTLDDFFLEFLVKRINGRDDNLVGLGLDVGWSDSVSNTHSCPHNGVTNWGGRVEGAPRGYPGWCGRIWVRYKREPQWGSDPLCVVRVFSGTGGFGGYNGPWEKVMEAWHHVERSARRPRGKRKPEPQCYGYGVELFAADFPELVEVYDMERAQLRLEGKDVMPRINKSWTHPDVLQEDKELIAQYKTRAAA